MASKKEIVFILLLIFGWSISQAQPTMQFGPIEFQLISGWSCQMSDQSMICLDRSPTSSKNSAVVFSYKQRGATDHLSIYKDQLARPRVLQIGDINQPSTPKGVREIRIQGHPWIEGIHLGSEMSNYVTHYFATTHQDYAILASLSLEAQSHDVDLPKVYPIIDSIRFQVRLEPDGSMGIDSKQTAKRNENRAKMVVLGNQKVHVYYIYLGLAALLVLGLLVYALKS